MLEVFRLKQYDNILIHAFRIVLVDILFNDKMFWNHLISSEPK